jgi:hypothetical protein
VVTVPVVEESDHLEVSAPPVAAFAAATPTSSRSRRDAVKVSRALIDGSPRR